MKDIRETVSRCIKELHLPQNPKDLLQGFFSENPTIFHLQESLHWDYKDRFPTSQDKEYTLGILRLVCAFFNTYGGIIIFGIHDKLRTVGHNKTVPDIERFNALVNERLTFPIECVLRNYALPEGEISILLVPKRPMGIPPARFKIDHGKIRSTHIFGRRAHEVFTARSIDLPFFYSARDDFGLQDEKVGLFSIHRALPPPPATIREFIGRLELMDRLWKWLLLDDEPRQFLCGPGGSGKSTLAYEFARVVADSGRQVKTSSGHPIDFVVYLSAKESELNPVTGEIQRFQNTDFSTSRQQFQRILYLSGFLKESEIFDLQIDTLIPNLKELFSAFYGLIIVDDIDSLIRKKIDPGMEQLLMSIFKGSKGSKVLYTMRGVPSIATNNAIVVPGLHPEHEYMDFVEACCRQFQVTPPPPEFTAGALATESGYIPLIIELVCALRRRAGNWLGALDLYKNNKGDRVRDYLYKREYDFLDADNRARTLLAVLSLSDKPLSFGALTSVLQWNSEQISESIGEILELFLNVDDSGGGDSLYSLSNPVHSFVDRQSRSLNNYEQIKARLLYFNATYMPDDRRVSELSFRIMDLLNQNDASGALREFLLSDLPPAVTEHPRIQRCLGRVYSSLSPVRLEDARKSYNHAFDAGLRDRTMMREWYYMESKTGYSYDEALHICDKVIADSEFNQPTKSEFYSKKGWLLTRQAKAKMMSEPANCLNLHRESIYNHLQAVRTTDYTEATKWLSIAVQEYTNAAYILRRRVEILDFIWNLCRSRVARFDFIVPMLLQHCSIMAGTVREISDTKTFIGHLNKLRSQLGTKALSGYLDKSSEARILEFIAETAEELNKKLQTMNDDTTNRNSHDD